MNEATLDLHITLDGETVVNETYTARNIDRSQVTVSIKNTLRSAVKLLEHLADKEAEDD